MKGCLDFLGVVLGKNIIIIRGSPLPLISKTAVIMIMAIMMTVKTMITTPPLPPATKRIII